MVTPNFLSPGEVDIIETAKAKKKLKAERKQLAKSKKELKPETIGVKEIAKSAGKGIARFSKGFGSVITSKGKSPFGRRIEPESFTKEQHILRGMFGHGEKVLTSFDGRGLPRLDNTLNNPMGKGLLKSGDQGETRNLMASGNPSGLFGGKRQRDFKVTDFKKDFNPIFGNQLNQQRQRRKNPLF